ncbi:AAA family ATPase [Larkinella soli]|uniref:AAA family ATPase n=1 Tax=Larkinella soli TaxID=1770527 RepID=UPI000FFC168F|nr:AAA family ATPase [Larkinella soli]
MSEYHKDTQEPPIFGMSDEDLGDIPNFEFTSEGWKQNGKEKAGQSIDYEALKKAFRVLPDEDLPPDQVCLSIQHNDQTSTFGTLGNFSAVIGKPKAKKTFSITAAVAAALSSEKILRFTGSLPPEKRVVIHLDMEQSRFHVLRVVKRICRLAGQEMPENLHVYSLRSLSTEQRLALTKWLIYNTPNLGLVVIDGIRDLVVDINDNAESTARVDDLLRWTYDLNIHLMVIIHQNKGNDMIRGVLGTEIQNKSETVVSVALDPNDKSISIVKPEYCRDKEFEEFAFQIDEYGLPKLVSDWEPEQKGSGKKNGRSDEEPKAPRSFGPSNLESPIHQLIVWRAFQNVEPGKHAATKFRIKEAAAYYGYSFGDNKAVEFLTYYLDCGLIRKEGQTYHLNLPPQGDQVDPIIPTESTLL